MASCLLAPAEATSERGSRHVHPQTAHSSSTVLQRIHVVTQLQLGKAGGSLACRFTWCMHGPKHLPPPHPLHEMRCVHACPPHSCPGAVAVIV